MLTVLGDMLMEEGDPNGMKLANAYATIFTPEKHELDSQGNIYPEVLASKLNLLNWHLTNLDNGILDDMGNNDLKAGAIIGAMRYINEAGSNEEFMANHSDIFLATTKRLWSTTDELKKLGAQVVADGLDGTAPGELIGEEWMGDII